MLHREAKCAPRVTNPSCPIYLRFYCRFVYYVTLVTIQSVSLEFDLYIYMNLETVKEWVRDQKKGREKESKVLRKLLRELDDSTVRHTSHVTLWLTWTCIFLCCRYRMFASCFNFTAIYHGNTLHWHSPNICRDNEKRKMVYFVYIWKKRQTECDTYTKRQHTKAIEKGFLLHLAISLTVYWLTDSIHITLAISFFSHIVLKMSNVYSCKYESYWNIVWNCVGCCSLTARAWMFIYVYIYI